MTQTEELHRRARRLVRCYPKEWRSRYGDEFTQLLLSEMSEQPRSARRSANVAWNAGIARAAAAGLGGRRAEAPDQLRRCLVTLGWAAVVFLPFGIAMWAQLTIGWQWAEPGTGTTAIAMVVMTGAVLLLAALALAAALPVAWAAIIRALGHRARGLTAPSALFVAATAVLVIGGRHFANGWPGTGGHPWSHQGIVPGGVAAFAWATTLSITSYWAHPGALMTFPGAEVAWMAVSPVAVVCAAVGATKVVRRLDLSPRVIGFERRLAPVAALGMFAFWMGACLWVVHGGPGPRGLFHVGAIDEGGLLVMALALAVAGRAVQQARNALAFSAR